MAGSSSFTVTPHPSPSHTGMLPIYWFWKRLAQKNVKFIVWHGFVTDDYQGRITPSDTLGNLLFSTGTLTVSSVCSS